jgi:rRNA maturation endonuclease Nob1
VEERITRAEHDLVRCLECGTEYALPPHGEESDPCPECGSVGWIVVEAVSVGRDSGDS